MLKKLIQIMCKQFKYILQLQYTQTLCFGQYGVGINNAYWNMIGMTCIFLSKSWHNISYFISIKDFEEIASDNLYCF